MIEELPQLGRDDLVLPSGVLTAEPQDPVPEVRVDPLERGGAHPPRRLESMRLLRKDEIDLYRTAEQEHPALMKAQSIPLLGEWIERSQQPRECIGDGGEVARVDAEVPIGSIDRASFGPRADELDLTNCRVIAHESDDTFGERGR
jgi:hypothetical protein